MFKPAISDDSAARVTTVNSQRELELELAASENAAKTAAIFVVPSILTPLFVNPADVIFDEESQLFKLKEGAELPDGLVTAVVAADPKQLSTVLGRVHSVLAMLSAGMKLVILAQNGHQRPKAEGKEGMVDDRAFQQLMQQFPSLISVHPIEAPMYVRYKTQVCAANYCSDAICQGVDAAQVGAITPLHKWGLREKLENELIALNKLLAEVGLPNAETLNSAQQAHRADQPQQRASMA